jgi:FkbM family methyltransferase
MYSQHHEEQVILDFFNHSPKGRFLDIGAYNGKTFSNTLALVELGWEGVCTEPSPKAFFNLLTLHQSNPKIKCVNAAVVLEPDPKLSVFYCSLNNAVSSLLESHKDKWQEKNNTVYSPYYLTPIPLSSVFSAFGYEFDLINIDIEGCSADLFLNMPLDKLTSTSCFCIEHDRRINEITTYAEPFGYTLKERIVENVVLTK